VSKDILLSTVIVSYVSEVDLAFLDALLGGMLHYSTPRSNRIKRNTLIRGKFTRQT
jgi:hypothetical protein